MEPSAATPPLIIDYSRCVSINIDGLASVLSGFNSTIQTFHERLDQVVDQIQKYPSVRLEEKDAEIADEIVRLKSRVLKCERESEKAKEIPDIQYEMKEMQFTLAKLATNLADHDQKLTGHEERIVYSLTRAEEIKGWLSKQIKDDLEDFEHDKVTPFQVDIIENVKSQVLRMQDELKQTFAPAASSTKLASMKSYSENDFESPQLIFSKIANLHARVKRLEDTAVTSETEEKKMMEKEQFDKLTGEVAELSEAVKAMAQEGQGEGRRGARKQTRVTFAPGGQSMFIQRMEEFEKVIENKASIDQVVSLEGN